LVPNVAEIIDPLAELVGKTRGRDDVDLIYVNANYGDFTAGPGDLVRSALEVSARISLSRSCRIRGRGSWRNAPSAFCSTALGYLLGYLNAQRAILTGQVTAQCILYIALEAYARRRTPDAVGHIDPKLGDPALKMMQRNMKAEIKRTEQSLP
jgi:hypothetical protein